MAVPSYDRFIEPILRFLALRTEGAPAREVHDAAADALHLTDADRAELLPSGVQRVYKNRAGWAHDRLKRAGLSASLARKHWQLTDSGRFFAREHPAPLSDDLVDNLASAYNDVRLRPLEVDQEHPIKESVPVLDRGAVSPDERLEHALSELRQGVVGELFETLSRISPEYFETLVLDLLHKMGYGASRSDLMRVGRSGDGGIDGVISLDRLGLDKVYVQAKRWQGSVGRPEIQGFYGALAGQRASKGVFITTSVFSSQAVDFAASVERIVLIDGRKLADLMIEHEVGITSRSVRVPKIDSDYFEE